MRTARLLGASLIIGAGICSLSAQRVEQRYPSEVAQQIGLIEGSQVTVRFQTTVGGQYLVTLQWPPLATEPEDFTFPENLEVNWSLYGTNPRQLLGNGNTLKCYAVISMCSFVAEGLEPDTSYEMDLSTRSIPNGLKGRVASFRVEVSPSDRKAALGKVSLLRMFSIALVFLGIGVLAYSVLFPRKASLNI